jgi:hypothetical protein
MKTYACESVIYSEGQAPRSVFAQCWLRKEDWINGRPTWHYEDEHGEDFFLFEPLPDWGNHLTEGAKS